MDTLTPPLPDLAALVDPLLGLPYADYNCWGLLRKLYGEAWQIDFEADPALAVQQVQEIWWENDVRDPLDISRPWDIWIMKAHGFASQHVGIVFDTEKMVHTKPRNGVCLETLRRWRPRLLQIARLRRLL